MDIWKIIIIVECIAILWLSSVLGNHKKAIERLMKTKKDKMGSDRLV